MKPTNELRFVERKVIAKEATWNSERITMYTTKNILQQKWEGRKRIGLFPYTSDDWEFSSEWRDVHIEKETP